MIASALASKIEARSCTASIGVVSSSEFIVKFAIAVGAVLFAWAGICFAGLPLPAPPDDFRGVWERPNEEQLDGCSCYRCIDIRFDKPIHDFCVESNQVFVRVRYEHVPGSFVAKLFFDEPTDLGRGGASLPWDDFDRSKPLATILLSHTDPNEIAVRWHGFSCKSKSCGAMPYGKGYDGKFRRRVALGATPNQPLRPTPAGASERRRSQSCDAYQHINRSREPSRSLCGYDHVGAILRTRQASSHLAD